MVNDGQNNAANPIHLHDFIADLSCVFVTAAAISRKRSSLTKKLTCKYEYYCSAPPPPHPPYPPSTASLYLKRTPMKKVSLDHMYGFKKEKEKKRKFSSKVMSCSCSISGQVGLVKRV